MTDLQNPIFTDETAAREALEAARWPNGPYCPHCGNTDQERIAKIEGTKRSHRPGLYYCNECKGQFTVTVGTVFERSKVPLTKWWLATHLLGASKKGMSAHQLHRMLGVTYKTAWFMSHRIREAMRDGSLAPMGGDGGTVEADETYFGKQENPQPSKQRKGRPYIHRGGGPAGKRAVVALVERGGRVRSFHPAVADKVTVGGIVADNISSETVFYTDESRLYGDAKDQFTTHETVKHSAGEYVRGDVHTNTIEGVFSIFKRGMKGIYQHCAEKHLHRYLAEYDFRYNHRVKLGFNDVDRAIAIIKGAEGKRLTYRRPHEA
jgi:transposase-like protein